MDDHASRPLPVPVVILALVTGILAMGLGAHLDVLGTRGAIVVGQLALLAPFALSAAALGVSARDAFAWQGVRWRDLALSVGCGLGLWIASAGLLQLQYAVWPPPPHVVAFFESLHSRLDLWPPWQGAFSLLAIAVLPAITEETAFRGALLGSLRRGLGDRRALLVTAAVFGGIHYWPGGYRIPFTLALGLALGLLRLRSGSLVPVVISHAVLNATTVVVASRFGDVTTPTDTASIGGGMAALLGGATLTLAFARALRRDTPTGATGSTLD